MSMWTHVTGCIYVDTMHNSKDIKKYVEKILKDAPLITGSEQNADIFINPLSGYNTSVFNRDNIEDFQTCAAITIVADLRDREMEKTQEEIVGFTDFIRDKFLIIDTSLRLTDGNTNTLFLSNGDDLLVIKNVYIEKEKGGN